MDQRDFFISYTASDEAWARKIARILTGHGYTVHVQYEDSPYGESIYTWMNQALMASGNFIAVWSRAYESSENCKGEIEAAYGMKIRGRMGKFLPVLVEDIPLWPLYGRFGRVDLFGLDDARIEERILRAVGYRGPVQTPPAPVQTTDPAPTTDASTFAGLSAKELYQRGSDYCYGRNGVQQDYAKARDYYEQAAAMGHAVALNDLVYLYENGYGVPKDYAKARECYERVAAMGNALALNNLGVLYRNGYGVPKDYAKAREYYEQAAAMGNASALRDLGYLYQNGYGVPQDYAKAREYYEQAAAMGNAPALNNLGYLYQNGYSVPQDYAKAREYYEQAAAMGNAPALNNLGVLYRKGYGVPQDYAKARDYYERAAAKGDRNAYYNLGLVYEFGRGVQQDDQKALEWYQKAADLGDGAADDKVSRLRRKLRL